MILEYIEGHLVDLTNDKVTKNNIMIDMIELIRFQSKNIDRDANAKIVMGILSKHGIDRPRDELVIVSQKIAKKIDEFRE